MIRHEQSHGMSISFAMEDVWAAAIWDFWARQIFIELNLELYAAWSKRAKRSGPCYCDSVRGGVGSHQALRW